MRTRTALVVALLALLAVGCRKKPTIERVPENQYHPPSASQSAAP